MKLTLLLSLIFSVNSIFSQIYFKPQKREIYKGDTVQLKWNIDKVKRDAVVSIKGIGDSLDLSGVAYVTLFRDTYYKLTIAGKRIYHKKTVKVKVLEPEFRVLKTLQTYNTDEDSVTIIWEAENSEYVTFNGREHHYKITDTVRMLLDTTTILTATAFNKNGYSCTKKLEVYIENVEFVKAPAEIYIRDTALVRWKQKFTKYVTIDGIDKMFKPNDTVSLIPDNDTVITLNIFRENGDTLVISKRILVNSPIRNFSCPDVVIKGQKPTLSWYVIDGFSCEITGVGDSVITSLKGNISIPVSSLNSYQIVVKDRDKVTVAQRSVKIKEVRTPVLYFKSSASEVVKGFPLTLAWKLYEGYTANIEDVIYGVKGKGHTSVIPFKNTEYKLVVFKDSEPVDTAILKVSVHNIRSYVKQIRDISELPDSTKIHFEIFSVDNSKYPEEVKLYLMAVDEYGNFITGLQDLNKKRKKEIITDVMEQHGNRYKKILTFKFIEHRVPSNIPYNISLALDYSGSMYYSEKFLYKSVVNFIKNKGINDNITITKFSDNLLSKIENENDTTALLTCMRNIGYTGGGTALYAGADFAQKSIPQGVSNKVLILFTDGIENSSYGYIGQYAYTATQLIKYARKNNITIHVVGLGNGVNNDILYKIAKQTGGNFYNGCTQTLSDIFGEFPVVLRNYYTISYKPVTKEGFNTVIVSYDNLQGKTEQVATKYQVGDKIVVSEVIPGKNTYWNSFVRQLNKMPTTTPQVLVLFDFDKYILDEKAKEAINTYADILRKNPDLEAVIFGHTDMKGSDKYCDVLSLKRAEKVKSYLVNEEGIEGERIYVKGVGKKHPIWSDDSIDWKAHENRRIEIVLMK